VQRPAQIIRIAAMVRELLGEVRQSSPDDAGRKRLRDVYERTVAELREGLSEGLQQELDTLTLPLASTPSESEIRLAQAQLVGWLEGLFQGIQAAVWAQQVQAQAQLQEMRRRGLPVGLVLAAEDGRRGPGQYL
jgi:proteasome activator-like protein